MSVGNVALAENPLDHFGVRFIKTVTEPFERVKEGAEAIADSLVPQKYVHKKFDNQTPPISRLAYRVLEFYIDWHVNVVRNSMVYARNWSSKIVNILKWPLTPLTYAQTGTAIQRFVCETVIGSVISAVIFCALQVFHIFPYFFSIIALTGTYVFYQTAPVAFITTLAASILLLNVYVLYYVAGEVSAAADTIRGEFKGAEVKVQAKGLEIKDAIEPQVKLFGYATVGLLAVSAAVNAVVCTILINKAL